MNDKSNPIRFVFRLEGSNIRSDGELASFRHWMNTYHPTGSPPLNKTEWRGMPERSCSIQRLSCNSQTDGKLQIEVEYRPRDWISFVGDTKYVGWTAYVTDRAADGTLRDGNGNPLRDGEAPVLLPFEVYSELEFNDLDFGELIAEIPLIESANIEFDEVLRLIEKSGHVKIGSAEAIAVVHRFRPRVKILISPTPTGLLRGGLGEVLHNVNLDTPHLKQEVANQLLDIVRGYLEGRYDLPALQGTNVFMLDLSGVIVDATAHVSRFDCLLDFLPEGFLTELARRVSTRYRLKARVVTGKSQGLLLEFEDSF